MPNLHNIFVGEGVCMIPDFDSTGNLPEGIHLASMEELVDRFGYNPKRAWLIDGLKLLICALQKANCPLVYIDGSFGTSGRWFWQIIRRFLSG